MSTASRLKITVPAVLFGLAFGNLYFSGKHGGTVSYIDIAGALLGLALLLVGLFSDVYARQRALEDKVGAVERHIESLGGRA